MQSAANGIKRHHPRTFLTGGIFVAAATGVGVAMWTVAAGVARDVLAGVPMTPSQAIVGLAAFAALLLVAWLLLGVALEVLARVPGAVGRAAEAVAETVSPAVLRRAAVLTLGVSIGAGISGGSVSAAPRPVVAVARDVATPALGSNDPITTPDLPDPSWGTAAPDPGWTPDPPRVRPQPDLSVLTGRARAEDRQPEVVVRRGDSLWAIAARDLGEGATDVEIAAAWPRWYEANRHVVGPDPDVLRPGQVLRAPTSSSAEVGS